MIDPRICIAHEDNRPAKKVKMAHICNGVQLVVTCIPCGLVRGGGGPLHDCSRKKRSRLLGNFQPTFRVLPASAAPEWLGTMSSEVNSMFKNYVDIGPG